MRHLTPQTFPKVNFTPVPGGVQASARLVSQQALHAMTMNKALHAPDIFTPRLITNKLYKSLVPTYAHFALPMVHLTTGETITSYKHFIHDMQWRRCGRLCLARTLAVWHRAMTRRAKKAQIQCLSWHGKKLMWQKQQGQNGLMPALWLTFDHKKTILIESTLWWVATYQL